MTVTIGRSSQRRRWASSASVVEIAKPIATAIAVSSMCWRSAGHNTPTPVARDPVEAEQRVRPLAAEGAAAEVRDHRTGGGRSATTPPPPPLRKDAADQLERELPGHPIRRVDDHQRRATADEQRRERIAEGHRVGHPPVIPIEPGGSRQLDLGERREPEPLERRGRRRRTARRTRRPGALSSSSGVAYWASVPPWRRIAIRSPILIASSMSWVTNTTVFGPAPGAPGTRPAGARG